MNRSDFARFCHDRNLVPGVVLMDRHDADMFTIERVQCETMYAPAGLWTVSDWHGRYFIAAGELGDYCHAFMGDALVSSMRTHGR